MYIAELNGKLSSNLESKEDILTSNVFSFFKYSDRDVYLRELIQKIGINVSNNELRNAEFIFWPKYGDKTEPDLVIIIGEYYLLFEAKYFSDFSADQIKREIEGGMQESKNLGKKFYYIAITQDYYYKEERFKHAVKMTNNHFKWINWQSVSCILSNVLEKKGDTSPDFLFASDLLYLLIKKNLRGYQSFIHLDYPYANVDKNIFFSSDTARFRGKFIGFTAALLKNQFNHITGKEIFYKRRKQHV